MRIVKLSVLFLILNTACSNQEHQKEMGEKHKFTNQLINETSPYLLQHAHNPVDWYPWNEKTLEKAQKEEKLLIISIGYSACHWCHVMEHETFEDESVAKIMNENFICVKVDREERPDIDQIYMTAVHLMNQRGGWPLNCIALANGKPFWGGTYFTKEDWKNQILEIYHIYNHQPKKVFEYAEKLSNGIKQVENIIMNNNPVNFIWKDLDDVVKSWKKTFDNLEGGSKGNPKFPMPNSYNFLLHYAHHTKDDNVLEHIELTLDKMAYGGIYDQIGGGFARYSTDENWKIPHFEKMLYDNGQLVSLYSEAFLKFKKPLYRDVVFQTLDFVERELMSHDGAFFSALDADSEGEEGKFYIWNKQDLQSIIGKDFEIFKDYYNINRLGFWEHGNYILLRKKSDEAIVKKHKISLKVLKSKIKNWKEILLSERDNRVHPGLDDKSLTSWNALMLKGYIDAYFSFHHPHHLDIALKNAEFIIDKQMQSDGRLWHSYKNGKSTINGYLEDYALVCSAFLRLYEATFDESWLKRTELLVKYSLENFYNLENGMFYFTSKKDPKLITRKMEITDNVIPASNSVMAHVLFDLGVILDNQSYKKKAMIIANNIKPEINQYPSGYANYADLILKDIVSYYEVAIVGKDAHEKALEINKKYVPNKLFIGSYKNSSLEILKQKHVQGSTMIYICENKICQLPTSNVLKAKELMK